MLFLIAAVGVLGFARTSVAQAGMMAPAATLATTHTLPGVLVSAAADPTGHGYVGEWLVFADRADVHTLPNFQSPVIGVLRHGAATTGEILRVRGTDEEWLRMTYHEKTGYVSLTTINRVHPYDRRRGNLPIGKEVVDRWWGLPMNYQPTDLRLVPQKYSLYSDRQLELRAAALAAFEDMAAAAAHDGVQLRIVSAFRSGQYQEHLFERACRREGMNQRASAPPGHSEHQLGTTMDLADASGRHVLNSGFGNTRASKWLIQNAARFGFRRSYWPKNEAQTGYISEPWHYRYWGRPVQQQTIAAGGQ